MKGEIQEFSNSEISIGRYPSCHAQFPKDLRIVSREHARIIREGNRFKLINHSKNGTYLNGKRIPEAYLKDGDVLIFAQGVPKVSFLTKVEEGGRHEEAKKDDKFDFGVQKKQIPLVIRYGPILRQFKNLPITIG